MSILKNINNDAYIPPKCLKVSQLEDSHSRIIKVERVIKEMCERYRLEPLDTDILFVVQQNSNLKTSNFLKL